MLLRGNALWTKLVIEQEKWIEQCGGNLDGYISNYCYKYKRSARNAIEIYCADINELRKRLEVLVQYE